MSKLKSGSCTITVQDAIDMPLSIVEPLLLLRKFGAPIIGNMFLEADPRYVITQTKCPLKAVTYVTWEPKNDKPS